jgi:hypothetical protein
MGSSQKLLKQIVVFVLEIVFAKNAAVLFVITQHWKGWTGQTFVAKKTGL